VTLGSAQKNANYDNTTLIRLAAVWTPNDKISIHPQLLLPRPIPQ